MNRNHKNRVHAGRLAETYVARVYQSEMGFKVTGQNLRLGPYEIDLLVQKPHDQRIVEVRSSHQRTLQELSWSLVGKKARNLRKTIREMRRRGILESQEFLQVDAALVRWNDPAPPTVELWHNIFPADLGL